MKMKKELKAPGKEHGKLKQPSWPQVGAGHHGHHHHHLRKFNGDDSEKEGKKQRTVVDAATQAAAAPVAVGSDVGGLSVPASDFSEETEEEDVGEAVIHQEKMVE